MFVANHFTRLETFVIPYLIYKHTKRHIRCLADDSLFKGIIGKILSNFGAVSTKNLNRDNIIISDLIKGDCDWMIYPEGAMIKSKEIYDHGKFLSHTPNRIGYTRTGSAVLALKSELYRSELIHARKQGDKELILKYKEQYGIRGNSSLRKLEEIHTNIVPITITYYPIRPGNNIIKKIADKIFKNLSANFAEELEIEGNLILNSHINIDFKEAINLQNYTKNICSLIGKIPIIKSKSKTDLILQYLKRRLTSHFMAQIYGDIRINIDHIFAAILYYYKKDKININHFKGLIYLCSNMIEKNTKHKINYSIEEKNLYKILTLNQAYDEFEDIVNLAKKVQIIQENKHDEYFLIDKNTLIKKRDFHQIRLKNTLQVILNEFLLLQNANNIIKYNINLSENNVRQEVFKTLCQRDIESFNIDYKRYYDSKLSKLKTIGSPFFLNSNNKNNIGVLICHGLMSAPKEVKDLAEFLNNSGFKIYVLRLKGHGTAPVNMKDVTWQDWYQSFQRAFAALNSLCGKIVIIGFSTGGLLSLLFSSKIKDDHKIKAVIAINSALYLRDIRSKFTAKFNLWNELLNKFKIKKRQFEYTDLKLSNPEISYSIIYLKALKELEELMSECRDSLENISIPTLIAYSKNDIVVNPKSSKIIFKEIKSKNKQLLEINSNKHTIINKEYEQDLFLEIKAFIDKL